jgi:hypothetical protein
MTLASKNARVAGFLYLLLIIAVPFRLIYIPRTLFVSGNATATANNIAVHESLFRLGIVSDLFCGTILIFLVQLSQFYAAVWTIDLRDQGRRRANLDRKVETDPVQHPSNDIGIRVFRPKSHQRSSLGREQRGMR